MTMKTCLLTMLLLLSLNAGANTLPDPTKPYGYDTPRTEIIEFIEPREGVTWILSGVRISEQDRSAILNGKVVRAGDWIKDARVISIETDAVVIEHLDDQIRIRLLDYDIKQRKDIVSAQRTDTVRERSYEK